MCALNRRAFLIGGIAVSPQKRTPEARFFQRAAELARRAVESGDGTAFGAVIVKDGVIVAEGWNRTRAAVDPTAHSEIEAIRNACKKLNRLSLRGYDLYSNAQPCSMCAGAIRWAELDNVFVG